MPFCPLITQTLRTISVRCIPLSLRSKTRRRATLLLPPWICSSQSVGTVNFKLPLTTNVTISIHITNFPFPSSNIPSSSAYGWRHRWILCIGECPSIASFLETNGRRPCKGLRSIVFKEWNDTRTFDYIKSTHWLQSLPQYM